MEPGPLRVRLSLMMFWQYIIIGAWAVPLATFLLASPESGGLGFTPSQTAAVYSATALIGLVAPLFLSLLADRLFPTQTLLGVLHLAGAVVLVFAGRHCERTRELLQTATDPEAVTQSAFTVMMAIMLVNAFILVTTIALANVTAFRNLREPKRSFSGVRLYGTVAWIVVNLGIDLFGDPMSAQPLYVGAVCSVLMGIYSFTLPHTPPKRGGHRGGFWRTVGDAMGWQALGMFRTPGFAVLIVSALCMAGIQQFYSVYANAFLKSIDAPKPTAIQTLAQVFEVACMVVMPWFMMRFGMRITLAVGIGGWVIRNLLFATGWLPAVIVCGLPLHGLCYTFFFVAANVFVDRHAPPDRRAGAQGIFTFVSMGLGTLLGNYVSARALETHTVAGVTEWTWFWLVPAIAAAVVFLGFWLTFPTDDEADRADVARLATTESSVELSSEPTKEVVEAAELGDTAEAAQAVEVSAEPVAVRSVVSAR